VTYPPAPRPTGAWRLDIVAFGRITGTHPDLIRRLIALGALDPPRDTTGTWWFGPEQLAAIARIQRLRAGLGLNYAALGLVVDLLDRVADLERQLRATSVRPTGGSSWT
jgi:chaperone modulatory protein CbpM